VVNIVHEVRNILRMQNSGTFACHFCVSYHNRRYWWVVMNYDNQTLAIYFTKLWSAGLDGDKV